MDQEDLKLLIDAVVQTQGSGQAVCHILLELVIRISRTQPDRSGFLKGMFESVSAKIDQVSNETAKKRAHAEERLTLSTFFSVAEKAVQQER